MSHFLGRLLDRNLGRGAVGLHPRPFSRFEPVRAPVTHSADPTSPAAGPITEHMTESVVNIPPRGDVSPVRPAVTGPPERQENTPAHTDTQAPRMQPDREAGPAKRLKPTSAIPDPHPSPAAASTPEDALDAIFGRPAVPAATVVPASERNRQVETRSTVTPESTEPRPGGDMETISGLTPGESAESRSAAAPGRFRPAAGRTSLTQPASQAGPTDARAAELLPRRPAFAMPHPARQVSSQDQEDAAVPGPVQPETTPAPVRTTGRLVPAPVDSLPAADAQPAAAHQSQPAPVIHVTIGRIEVRAVAPPAPASAPRTQPARPRPALTLDEYLKRREGGQR